MTRRHVFTPRLAAALLATVAATLAPTPGARAYTLYYDDDGDVRRWEDPTDVVVYFGEDLIDAIGWRDAVEYVDDEVYLIPGDHFIDLDPDDDGDQSLDNGESEILVTDDDDLVDEGAAYCTWWVWSDGTIDEADVVVDWDPDVWSTFTKANLWAYGGDTRAVEGVLLHELGHLMGLGHEDGVYNVMGEEWNHVHTTSTTAKPYFGEDASTGLVALYGEGDKAEWVSPENVAVSHWKWDPATSDEYSDHMRTEVFDSAGVLLSATWESDEPYFKVDKGQKVKVEFTYENLGSNSQTRTAKFYVSTNATISSGDTYLTSFTPTVLPDAPYTIKRFVTLPSSLTSGKKYWIGVIVDATSALAENHENDNSAYVGIQVK